MRYDRNPKVNIGFLCLLFCLCISILTGCGKSGDGTKVVLTTGLGRDEVFRIEAASCTKAEMMVYLTNMQNQYENVYGEGIWNTQVNGVTLEKSVKENALANMAQVKSMTLMAEDMGLELTSQENKQIENAADTYFGSLNNTEIEKMGISKNTIVNLYREYMLAQKVYQEIIKDVNPEVSDDEARNITIEYILIKSYAQDGTGKKIGFSENAKKTAEARAQEAYERACNGEDFDSLIAEYNESDVNTISFGKEDIDNDYVRTTLFDLANGDITPVMVVDDGYLIAKCVSTYNMEETDENKINIVEKQKETVFGQKYDEFVSNLTRKLNDTLWNEITFIHDPEVTTSNFFEVADENL